MDIDVAEFVLRKPVNCEVLTKKKKNTKALKSLKSNEKIHYSFDIN
jgi:hypothetical protein